MSFTKDTGGFNQLGGDAGFQIFGANGGGSGNVTIVYDTDALLIFTAMSPAPDIDRKLLINSFVVGCKTDGNWSLLDVLGFFSATNSTSALINWKSPGTFTPTLAGSPAPIFSADSGFTGSSTGYINTNYNPFTQGINFTLNNCSFGIYNLTNSSGFLVDIGSNDGGIAEYIFGNEDGVTYSYMGNTDPPAALLTSTALGFTSSLRTSSNFYALYRNGVLISSSVTASDHIANYNFFLLAGNQNGSPDFFTLRKMAFYFMGSGAINHLLLYNRVVTYLTGVGAI